MELSNIITINLTDGVAGVSRQGFGTVLIPTADANISARTGTYSTLGALALALVGGSNSDAYKCAAAILSQQPRPTSIKIGYISGTKIITDNAGTLTAGTQTITVNGTTYTQTFSSDKDTTLDALADKVAEDASVDTCVYSSGSHTITITPLDGAPLAVSFVIEGTGYADTISAVLSSVATEDIDDALSAIKLQDNDWYMIAYLEVDSTTQELLSSWVSADGTKVACVVSDDADIIDKNSTADTTSIAHTLSSQAVQRTFGVYGEEGATEFGNGALLGVLATRDPGSYTAAFKTLIGITPDALTPTQVANIASKNFNFYTTLGATNVLLYGITPAGGIYYIDYVIFKDWLTARLQEEIFAVLKASEKVPYTVVGFAQLRSAMENVFKQGQENGAVSDYSEDDDKVQNGGYNIVFPDIDEISSQDKAARLLQNVTFSVWYTNGIHTVEIEGTIQL